MKINNEFRCSFPAVSANEGLARAAVSAFLIPADPTAQELADLRTVISEAVTNAIVHGYRETEGDVYVTLRMLPERTPTRVVASLMCRKQWNPSIPLHLKKIVQDWGLPSCRHLPIRSMSAVRPAKVLSSSCGGG